ncbi:hypothetical protein NDU88_006694 [Pleurodeles waltl]|uniref:Uncharacterized protein n=1 Tax=Pleurodeles waltl TaxID=8319 RepID=A0AAV7MI42_PLEWA|nr:hypothetical protein NDU88_006694 [Pleurodeles waltl]
MSFGGGRVSVGLDPCGRASSGDGAQRRTHSLKAFDRLRVTPQRVHGVSQPTTDAHDGVTVGNDCSYLGLYNSGRPGELCTTPMYGVFVPVQLPQLYALAAPQLSYATDV